MEEQVRGIQANLIAVRDRIDKAARSCGRDPADVKLVVVSKGQPVDVIRSAVQAGVSLFGENYPEQAQEKILALRDAGEIEWHMIGHLQSRKAGIVTAYFHMLHSLDRVDLAVKLENQLVISGKTLPVLLEVNVGGEESKTGWRAEGSDQWDVFLPDIEKILSLPHLQVRGLMTMPPFFGEAELARPYFTQLARLRDFLSVRFPNANFRELSMGTSSDFEVAVQEGATFVRVGTAILGPRPAKLV